MTRRDAALAVALAAVLVLAGCAGTGPGTTTDSEATTTVSGATTATTDGATADDGTTTTTEESTASDGTTADGTDGPEATATKQRVLDAMAGVGTYRVDLSTNRTLLANGVRQSTSVESAAAFDREARRLRVNQTTSGPGGTATVATYVVDRSLYRHSEAFVRQYSSEWVTLDLSVNFSSTWRGLDTMTRQRATLANASVRLDGTTTVEGTEAYVLVADVDETSYNEVTASRLGSGSVDVSEASFTFRVSTETHRPLLVTGTVNSTVTTRGQEVAVTERLTLAFDGYGEPAGISLPDSAETAVSLDNATASGSSAAVARPGSASAGR